MTGTPVYGYDNTVQAWFPSLLEKEIIFDNLYVSLIVKIDSMSHVTGAVLPLVNQLPNCVSFIIRFSKLHLNQTLVTYILITIEM